MGWFSSDQPKPQPSWFQKISSTAKGLKDSVTSTIQNLKGVVQGPVQTFHGLMDFGKGAMGVGRAIMGATSLNPFQFAGGMYDAAKGVIGGVSKIVSGGVKTVKGLVPLATVAGAGMLGYNAYKNLKGGRKRQGNRQQIRDISRRGNQIREVDAYQNGKDGKTRMQQYTERKMNR